MRSFSATSSRREREVPGDEDGDGEPHLLEDALVQRRDFGPARLRERDAVALALRGKAEQAAVDDVADMLEVGREEDEVEAAARILFVERHGASAAAR